MTVGLDTPARPDEREQTRARYPDQTGFVERDGVRSFYEVYGEGEPTVLLVPTWSIVHSRVWKGQIPYLARHFRVVTFDGRGNGRSDRPADPEEYAEEEFAGDIQAVMDATGTERAILVCLSRGIERSMRLAAEHPDRVEGVVALGPAIALPPATPRSSAREDFTTPRTAYEGWDKWNLNYWRRDYEGFLEFFFSKVFTEPHSTKQIEDSIAWALETDAETLIATQLAPRLPDEASVRALAGADPLSAPRDPRHRGRRPPARLRRRAGEDRRRAAGLASRRGPQPRGPLPGQGQPADPRVR